MCVSTSRSTGSSALSGPRFVQGACDHVGRVHDLRRFFRENPQVLVLLLICVILGLGTFLIVIFGLATAGKNAQPNGEPSGAISRPQRLVRPSSDLRAALAGGAVPAGPVAGRAHGRDAVRGAGRNRSETAVALPAQRGAVRVVQVARVVGAHLIGMVGEDVVESCHPGA